MTRLYCFIPLFLIIFHKKNSILLFSFQCQLWCKLVLTFNLRCDSSAWGKWKQNLLFHLKIISVVDTHILKITVPQLCEANKTNNVVKKQQQYLWVTEDWVSFKEHTYLKGRCHFGTITSKLKIETSPEGFFFWSPASTVLPSIKDTQEGVK